jgi:hypothetical protein
MKVLTTYCLSDGWRVEKSAPIDETAGCYIYQEWELPVDSEAHWIFHCSWDRSRYLGERLQELGATKLRDVGLRYDGVPWTPQN